MSISINQEVMQTAIDQAVAKGARTPELSNRGGFKWEGTRSIKVVTINPVDLEDYSTSATLAERLAAIVDADTETETYTLTQRKSFAQKVEDLDAMDQAVADLVEKILTVQTDQKVIPAIDKYRIAVICATAQANAQTVTIAADGYDNLLDCANFLTNADAVDGKKLYFVDTTAYKSLRQSGMLTPYTETERKHMVKGTLGELEDFIIRKLPDSYFPTGFHACGLDVEAGMGPVKHQKTMVIDQIPGSFASVVQGLLYHDYFARKARKLCFAAVKSA